MSPDPPDPPPPPQRAAPVEREQTSIEEKMREKSPHSIQKAPSSSWSPWSPPPEPMETPMAKATQREPSVERGRGGEEQTVQGSRGRQDSFSP